MLRRKERNRSANLGGHLQGAAKRAPGFTRGLGFRVVDLGFKALL